MSASAGPSSDGPSPDNGQARRWLPSLPRPVDWIYAGAFVGAALGTCELLLLWLRGESPPTALAWVLLLAPTAGVAALCFLCQAAWFRGSRLHNRSQVVGFVLGPLFLWVAIGGGIEAIQQGLGAALAYWVPTLFGAAAAAVLGARAGTLLEEAALAPPGPWVWTLCAAFVAVSEQIEPSLRGLATALTAIALLVALAVVGVEWMKHNTRPSRSWGRAARNALLVGGVVVCGPAVAPWLLSEWSREPLDVEGPHVLIIAWPGDASLLRGAGFDTPTLGLLEAAGTAFEDVARISDSPRNFPAWLERRSGGSVLEHWAREGFATAEFLTRPSAGAGAADSDWRPGPSAWLTSAGQRSSSGRILAANGWGPRGEFRSSAELVSAASRWLIARQAGEPVNSLALYLDFRGDTPKPLDELEARLGELQEVLELWGGFKRCVVLLVLGEPGAGRAALLSGPLAPEPGTRVPPRERVAAPTHPAAIAERLIARVE